MLHITMQVGPVLHIVISAIATMFMSVGTMMQWGLVGDTIDYNELLLGKRNEGTIYGTFNMLRRVGQAIGTSGGVALLGIIGYDAIKSNMGLAQSVETVFGLKVLCILAPAIVTVGSWAAFRFVWKISNKPNE